MFITMSNGRIFMFSDNVSRGNRGFDAGSEFEFGGDGEEVYSKKEDEDYHKNDGDKSRDDEDIDSE